MEKNTLKKLLIFLVLTLFIINLVSADTQADLTKAYHDKLINTGLTEQEAATIIKNYPAETELRQAVREAVQNKQTEIQGISVEKFKKDFYLPGIVKTEWDKFWEKTTIFEKINDFTKGLFGGTAGDFFLWILGLKRNLADRGWDIATGAVAWILIWLLWLFELKRWKKASYTNKKNLVKHARWLRMIAGGGFLKTIFKLFLFVSIYFIVMQIPIANWVLRLLTLYNFSPIWLRPIILAMLVGYLPAIMERLIEYREAQHQVEEETEAQVAADTIKALGKYK